MTKLEKSALWVGMFVGIVTVLTSVYGLFVEKPEPSKISAQIEGNSGIVNTAQKQNNNNFNQNGNSGNITNNISNVPQVELKPNILVNLKNQDQSNPFKSEFEIRNGGSSDANAVAVEIFYINYKSDISSGCNHGNDIHMLGDIYDNDQNLRRDIGNVKAGDMNSFFVNDMVSSNGIDGFAGMGLGKCGTVAFIRNFGKDSDTSALAVENLELFSSAILCLKVVWSEGNSNSFKSENTGFIIDKHQGISKWMKRPQVCTQASIENNMARSRSQ